MLSSRFRAMYRNLGLNRSDVAKLLHFSEFTLHNWESGHHEIPYSAYRLLRVLTRQELPGAAWAGWHITAGVLWSPEGRGFKPLDSSWWGLLCRRSAQFHTLYAENNQLRHEARSVAPTKPAEPEKVKMQVTLHQILNFEKKTENIPQYEIKECPADKRLMRVRFASNLLKGGV
jgi:DNA-binding XRE family transcriptional regulator